jgi:transforming growth factor-beta-induced protein
MRKLVTLFFTLALVVGLLPGAALAQSDAPQDIVDIAVANEDFSTLVTAVTAAGLVDTLKSEGPFTVFAPTNEAFAKVPAELMTALLADPEGALTQILLYHVVPGKVMSSDLSEGLEATTVQGEAVTFSLADGAKVNDANIIAADVEASNGVIHVIDSVILPPSIVAALAAEADAAAMEEAPAEAAMEEAAPAADIVDTAVAAGDFGTLVTAVQAAGLVDALKGEGPFTVFAPNDAAFAKLPAGTIDALLADPTGDLTQILLYHVLPTQVLSTDLQEGVVFVPTLQGKTVKVEVKDGNVMVNDAKVVAADIATSNGVIHVIDSVILPPADEAAAEAAPAEEAAPTTVAASETAPETMPVTGGETTPMLALAIVALALLSLAGAAFVTRRQSA